MTEPDEALLWARGAGMPIYQHHTLAEAYRAGAAASAERIKALEGAVRSLIGIIDSNGLMHDPNYLHLGLSKRRDGQPGVERVKQAWLS